MSNGKDLYKQGISEAFSLGYQIGYTLKDMEPNKRNLQKILSLLNQQKELEERLKL